MSQLKAILFRRDRAWLTAMVAAVMLGMTLMLTFGTNLNFARAASGVTLNSPAASSSVNATASVNWSWLGSDATDGTITFTQTGGNPDAGSPHVYTMSGSDLTFAGSPHGILISALNADAGFSLVGPLVDGAIYDVKVASATDVVSDTHSSVTYDVSSPVVSAVSIAAGSYKIGSVVPVSITADAAGYTAGTITINGETLGSFSDDTGGAYSGTYTVISGDTDRASVGAIPVSVVLTDAAGNSNSAYTTAPTSGGSVTIDATRPTISSIVLGAGSGTGGAIIVGNTPTLTITFSEAVTAFDNTDITTIDNGGLSAVSSGDGGITWTATYTPNASVEDGTNVITVDKTGLTDTAGNAGTGSDSTSNFVIDTLAPQITNTYVTIDNSLCTGAGGTVCKVGDTVVFHWDDSATGDNNGDTASVVANLSSFGGSTSQAMFDDGSNGDAGIGDNKWTYSATVLAGSSDGSHGFSVTATDDAGNATGPVAGSTSVLVDDQAPTVTTGNISTSGHTGASSTYRIGDTVTATWDTSAGGDNNADITSVAMDFSDFGGGSQAANDSGTGCDVSSGDNIWTACYPIVAGAEDFGAAVVSVTATDDADNIGSNDSASVLVDDQALVVTTANVTVTGGEGVSPPNEYKIGDFAIATWTDSIHDAASVTVDFSQFGGGASVAANDSGTGCDAGTDNIWTACINITQDSLGALTSTADVSVTAVDDASNSTGPITDNEDHTVDTNRPTGTVTLDTPSMYDGDLIQGVTVTYNEAMNPASSPNISFSHGAFSTEGDGAWSVGNTVWTETFDLADANETWVGVTADSSLAEDAIGNAEGSDVPGTFDIDTQNPFGTVSVDTDPITNSSLTQTVTVVYSETMNTGSTPAILFTTDTHFTYQTDGAWSTTTFTNDTWTGTYLHDGTPEEVASVTASSSGATDAAGNTENSSFTGTNNPFAVDTQPATVTGEQTIDGYTPGTDGSYTAAAENGRLDAVLVTWDGPIDDSTVSGSGCDSLTVPDGFDIDAGNIIGCDTGATPNDNQIVLLLDDSTYDTSGTPEITYTAASGELQDMTSNYVLDQDDTATDAAPPVILSTQTKDVNANGQVDELVLTYSEPVTVTDAIAGDGFPDIALDGGYTIASAAYGSGGPTLSTTLLLTESGTPDTDVVIAATYTINGGTSQKIRDAAALEMGAAGAVTSITDNDGAAPAFLDANYFDENNDGTVDHVDVIFSEDVTASTWEDGDWTFPTAGDLHMTDDTNANVGEDNTGSAASDTISLVVSADADTTGVNGGIEPTVTYTSGAGVANSVKDAAGNATVSFGPKQIDDNAAPVLVSDDASNDYVEGTYGPVDGTVDTMALTFTEDITLHACKTADMSTTTGSFPVFTVTDDGGGNCTSSIPSPKRLTLEVTATPDKTGVDGLTEPTFAYVTGSGNLTDGNADPDTGLENEAVTSSPRSLYDGAGPRMVSATTDDANADGLIDTLDVVTTENIDPASLDTSYFSVGGGDYDVDGITNGTDGFTMDISSPSPSTTGDTGVTPTVEITNTILDAANGVGSGYQSLGSLDGAAPVICSNVACTDATHAFQDATEDGNVDRISLEFSETVEPVPAGDTGSDSELDADEIVINDNTVSTSAEGYALVAHTGAGVIVSFGQIANFPVDQTGDTGDDWSAGFNQNGLNEFQDAAGNIAYQGGSTTLTLDDQANPVIGDAYTQDTDHNGKIDQELIDFSEPLDSASVDGEGSDFAIDGYDSIYNAEGCGDCGPAGPNAWEVDFDAGSTPDTAATPAVFLEGTVSDQATIPNSLNGEVEVASENDYAEPVITETTPSLGGRLHPRSGDVILDFSEPMDTSTLDSYPFNPEFDPDPSGVTVAFSSDTYGNTEETISHTAWDNGTDVELDIATSGIFGAQDLQGNYLCQGIGVCDHTDPFDMLFTAENSSGGGGGGGGGGTVSTTPTVKVVTPSFGDNLTLGGTDAITWTTGGNGITTIQIEYSSDNGITWTTIADGLAKTPASWTWTLPTIATSTAKIKLDAKDSGGALLATSTSGQFSIGGTTTPTNPSTAGVTTDDQGRRWAPGSGTFGASPFDGSSQEISSVTAGWYIRSTNYNTVYRVESDGTRRPFWDATTFMTWGSSWNDVIWVTDATLATLPLGAPMVPKPGAIMVKISSDPNVYWVETNPDTSSGEPYVLRHVTDETVASENFGSDWSDKIIDIEPTTKARYSLTDGPDITSDESLDTSGLLTRDEIAARVAGM